jgi:hypothetical protein
MPVTPATVAPVPDQIIYTAQLPRVIDLTNAAAAQRLAIKQIVQTASEITVSYQFANGQTRTVSYQLLLEGNTAPVRVVAQAPAPVVVVAPSPGAYYYEPYHYCGPWYPPVVVRFGADFGFRRHWH